MRSLDELADPRRVGGQDGSIPIRLTTFSEQFFHVCENRALVERLSLRLVAAVRRRAIHCDAVRAPESGGR